MDKLVATFHQRREVDQLLRGKECGGVGIVMSLHMFGTKAANARYIDRFALFEKIG